MKVIMALDGLNEAQVSHVYETEKKCGQLQSKRHKGKALFVHTYDIVNLQTAMIQIKDYYAHSLKMVNLRDFREQKLKALIKAVLSAQHEFSQMFHRPAGGSENQSGQPEPTIHGNIKASNIFIEHAG